MNFITVLFILLFSQLPLGGRTLGDFFTLLLLRQLKYAYMNISRANWIDIERLRGACCFVRTVFERMKGRDTVTQFPLNE